MFPANTSRLPVHVKQMGSMRIYSSIQFSDIFLNTPTAVDHSQLQTMYVDSAIGGDELSSVYLFLFSHSVSCSLFCFY